VLVCLRLVLDFKFDFREMIIGITERIMDLSVGEVGISLPNGLHGISILRPLINMTDWNAGADNDGITRRGSHRGPHIVKRVTLH
jgi:hypothetical protein